MPCSPDRALIRCGLSARSTTLQAGLEMLRYVVLLGFRAEFAKYQAVMSVGSKIETGRRTLHYTLIK